MTVAEALEAIGQVGQVSTQNGKIRLRIPESAKLALALAIEVLGQEREEAIRSLERQPDHGRDWLKGRSVELWRDGHRFFLVADEEDRKMLIERGIGRSGETWTPAELELVARLSDVGPRSEIEDLETPDGGGRSEMWQLGHSMNGRSGLASRSFTHPDEPFWVHL